jgi:hypothetical protein
LALLSQLNSPAFETEFWVEPGQELLQKWDEQAGSGGEKAPAHIHLAYCRRVTKKWPCACSSLTNSSNQVARRTDEDARVPSGALEI